MSSVRGKARTGLAVVGVMVTLVAGIFALLILSLDSQLEPMRRESTTLFQAVELSRDVRAAYVVVAEQIIAREQLSLDAFDDVSARIVTLEETLPVEDRPLARALATQWRRFEASLEGNARAVESEAEALSHAADRIATAELGRALVRQRAAGSVTTATAIFGSIALLVIVVTTFVLVRSLSTEIVGPIVSLGQDVAIWTRGDSSTSVRDDTLEEVEAVLKATEAVRVQLLRHEQESVATARLSAIGQLAAGVAHEMNNPIGVIRGYIQIMTPAAGEESAALEDVLERLDACADVVSQLLSVTSPRIVRGSLAQEVRRLVPEADVDESFHVDDLGRWILGFQFLIRSVQPVRVASVVSPTQAIVVDGPTRTDAESVLWLELAQEFVGPIVRTPSGYRIDLQN